MSSRIFIIYDGRACGDRETDDAAILFNVGGDRQEAIDYMVEDNFGQCALYSYNEEGATSLTDERWEGDFIPGKGWLPNPQDQAASAARLHPIVGRTLPDLNKENK